MVSFRKTLYEYIEVLDDDADLCGWLDRRDDGVWCFFVKDNTLEQEWWHGANDLVKIAAKLNKLNGVK